MSRTIETDKLPEAIAAGLVFAVDPAGVGGVVLRSQGTPARDAWLTGVRALLPASTPFVKLPINVTIDRLLGGLDYAATLNAGRPVFANGLLAAADDGVVMLAMAERLARSTAAVINAALDDGAARVEREGFARQVSCRIGVVALDEGVDDDERVDAGIADRLGLCIDPAGVGARGNCFPDWSAEDIVAVRERLPAIAIGDEDLLALAGCAEAFAVQSARALLLAVRVARVAAALAGRQFVGENDTTLAARLVLAPRAQRLPPAAEQPRPPEPPDSDPAESADPSNESERPSPSATLDDLIVEATRAALPPEVLARLAAGAKQNASVSGTGRGGPPVRNLHRGRPIGVRPARNLADERIDLLATLKTAVPWQPLRRRERDTGHRRISLRISDVQVTRFQQQSRSTTIFAVDASGSQAAQRLAEVKGAIEILLKECYSRRDEVALVAFRGAEAGVLLAPTRALARARRTLAGLPGGGATPLALGIDAARELAQSVARQGRTPAIVFLTDGRANVARDGERGHERADADAQQAARLLRACGIRSMLVDTSRRPRADARRLAAAMAADYIPLPYADAHTLSDTVRRGVAAAS